MEDKGRDPRWISECPNGCEGYMDGTDAGDIRRPGWSCVIHVGLPTVTQDSKAEPDGFCSRKSYLERRTKQKGNLGIRQKTKTKEGV